MQVYVWWFNVDLSCLGRTINARHFLGAKPPIQLRHRWAQRDHSYHDSEPPNWMPNAQLINANCQAAKPNLPFLTSLVWRGRGSNPGLPHPERMLSLTTMLRGGGKTRIGQILAPSLHKIRSSNLGKYSWMTFILEKDFHSLSYTMGKFRYNMPFHLTYKKKCEKLYSVH